MPKWERQWDRGDYYTIGGSGRVIPDSSDQWTIERGLRERGIKLQISREDNVVDALRVTQGADVVIACGGAWAREGTDRWNLELDQHNFLVDLSASMASHMPVPPPHSCDHDDSCTSPGNDCCAPSQLNEQATCSHGLTPVRTGDGCFNFADGAYVCCSPAELTGGGEMPRSTHYPPLVVVALAPGAIVCNQWAERSAAILLLFLSGETTGMAAADVLLGSVSPSGKLPVTLPTRQEDVLQPCTDDDCVYSEGLAHGWKAFLGASASVEDDRSVAFPFGFGLSYSSFSYNWVGSLPSAARASDSGDVEAASPFLTLRVTVTNAGGVAAAEVAQLYLAFPPGYGEPPLLLRGFAKTAVLEPGAQSMLSFELSERDLSVWDLTSAAWRRATGTFSAFVGGSSRDQQLTHTFSA